jgi:hypothetical protein
MSYIAREQSATGKLEVYFASPLVGLKPDLQALQAVYL